MIIVRGKERKRDACGEFRQMISLHEMIVLSGIVILIMFFYLVRVQEYFRVRVGNFILYFY
jgi:hypothetical protein